MKHKVWWLAVAALAACGDDDGPLICPAGTEPREGVCVPVDGGRPDAGDEDGGLDADTLADAPMGCVPTGDADVPDPDFVDADCDGFDGELTAAVAVTPEGTPGPLGVAATASTISRAIDVAREMGLSQIWVADGDYEESIELVEGISIYGGYDRASWSRSTSAISRVVGVGPLLRGMSIDLATEVAAIRFEAADATTPGASSLASLLQDVANLHLRDVALVAGRGADGTSREQPAPGRLGRRGLDGGLTGATTQCGVAVEIPRANRGGAGGEAPCECGDGGAGGQSSELSERNRTGRSGEGYAPAGGSCDFGSPSANNGAPAAIGAAGGDGGSGASGRPGFDGVGGLSLGDFSSDGYAPSDGSAATNGREGQGGGGGGAARDARGSNSEFCVYYGAAGAGGGSGGCGGTGGGGGGGGGASVALMLVDSEVRMTRVELRAGSGGAGGDGARGGIGGEGGPGGVGRRGTGFEYRFERALDPIQPGGDGGAGGPGGQGGGGGGGGGGPSFGLVLRGDSAESPDSSSVFIDIGSGGPGGRGGGTANAGANGDAQPRFLLTLEE